MNKEIKQRAAELTMEIQINFGRDLTAAERHEIGMKIWQFGNECEDRGREQIERLVCGMPTDWTSEQIYTAIRAAKPEK